MEQEKGKDIIVRVKREKRDGHFNLHINNSPVYLCKCGDIRERLDYKTWRSYDKAVEDGSTSGRLFLGTDKEVYFYIGN